MSGVFGEKRIAEGILLSLVIGHCNLHEAGSQVLGLDSTVGSPPSTDAPSFNEADVAHTKGFCGGFHDTSNPMVQSRLNQDEVCKARFVVRERISMVFGAHQG